MSLGVAEFALFVGLVHAVEAGQADAFIDKLLSLGISRYWFGNKSLSALIQTAIQQRRGGSPITFIGLFTASGLEDHQATIWAKKWADCRGRDPVPDLKQLVKRVRRDAAMRELREMVAATQEMMRDDPRQILVWLPTIIQGLRGILQTARHYSPLPSVIWAEGRIPKVVARFHKMPTFNTMLNGGLWNGCLAIYGTPTSQGKSTFAYTMIAHAVASGHKTVLLSREATAAEATARILQAYGGFSKWEVENKQGVNQESHTKLLRHIRELDRFLAIYDRHSSDLGDFAEIIHWEQPILVVIDHIGLYGIDRADGLTVMGKRDPLGEMAEWLLDISRDEECTILATSQFSSEEQRILYKSHDLNPPRYYGSSRIANAADFCYIAMRYWMGKGQHWIKCKKDRGEGKIMNRVFHLKYSGYTRSYYELPPTGD